MQKSLADQVKEIKDKGIHVGDDLLHVAVIYTFLNRLGIKYTNAISFNHARYTRYVRRGSEPINTRNKLLTELERPTE